MKVIVLMGVSGAGKTTVGEQLARALGWRFLDADSLHPAANVAKMKSGVPLDDQDRAPWLAALRGKIAEALAGAGELVLACSALKRSYRQQLRVDPEEVRFVFLDVPREVLRARLAARRGHYMPASLLDSQLATLEAPADALDVDVTAADEPDQVVAKIRALIAAG